MTQPIGYLRDDFADNTIASAWSAAAVGSATVAEASGQARLTLPSNTAGSHVAYYLATGTYDLTSDGCYLNIAQMVSTSVAATARFELYIDSSNMLRWTQTSGTLKAQTTIAGVTVDRYSATWSGTTYKYLRIRESGGTVYWDSSSNGTSWTNRFSMANPFAVTALAIIFSASCGNIASPGAFYIEDFNLILPALTTNWRWVEGAWPLTHRFRNVTLAIDMAATVQGYLAVYSSIDTAGAPVSPVYYSGPIDSSGNLTVQSTQAAAQAMAVNLPLDGRWSLPAMVEARFIRLYCRSIDGSSFILREQYGRRLIQTDDIEAEAIRAHHIAAAQILADHIAAGAVTADKLTIPSTASFDAALQLIAFRVPVSLDTGSGIYQGTGTFASPTTGLKIFNSGGIGKLSTYNTGVEQVTLDTDGKAKAGGGAVLLDANGIGITAPVFSYSLINLSPVTLPRVNAIQWANSSGNTPQIIGSSTGQLLLSAEKLTLAIPLGGSNTSNYGINLQSSGAHSLAGASFGFSDGGSTSPSAFTVVAGSTAAACYIQTRGGLNVGNTTAAGVGEIVTTGNAGIGTGSIGGLGDGGSPRILQIHGSAYGLLALSSSATAASSPGVISFASTGISGGEKRVAIIIANKDDSSTTTATGSLSFYTVNAGTAAEQLRITAAGHILPKGTAGTQNLGDATNYFGDISYKTITDRGCLALIDEWELPDGRKVPATQVFQEMKVDPSKRTVYGEPMLDYATVPKHSRKAAPIATEDVYEDDPNDRGPDGKPKRKLKHRQGEKMGDDGVEMTSLFSQMIGAIRELTSRVAVLERGTNGRANRA